jgi:PhzF family phenazine biosynthesis protein
MSIPYYQVDTFTSRLFSGNPAGVCLLADWPSEGILQSIATENNLAETAFVVQRDSFFDLRWFTPSVEVEAVAPLRTTTERCWRSCERHWQDRIGV